MRIFILVFLFFILSCSTKMDQQKLLSMMVGTYKLTQAGYEFIIRDMQSILTANITVDNKFIVKDFEIHLEDKTNLILLGTFLEIRQNKAIFKLAANNKYIMANMFEKRLFLTTTNSKAVVDDVFGEIVVPIGVKESDSKSK